MDLMMIGLIGNVSTNDLIGVGSLFIPELQPLNQYQQTIEPLLESMDDQPEVTPAAEAPSVDDPEVEEAKLKELELNRLRRGRSSTILTSPQGLGNSATLLGG